MIALTSRLICQYTSSCRLKEIKESAVFLQKCDLDCFQKFKKLKLLIVVRDTENKLRKMG